MRGGGFLEECPSLGSDASSLRGRSSSGLHPVLLEKSLLCVPTSNQTGQRSATGFHPPGELGRGAFVILGVKEPEQGGFTQSSHTHVVRERYQSVKHRSGDVDGDKLVHSRGLAVDLMLQVLLALFAGADVSHDDLFAIGVLNGTPADRGNQYRVKISSGVTI